MSELGEWCMAHPWMTFFIALEAIATPARILYSIRKLVKR